MHTCRQNRILHTSRALSRQHNSNQHVSTNFFPKHSFHIKKIQNRFYATEGIKKKPKKSARQDVASAEDPLLDEEFANMKIKTLVYHGEEDEALKTLFTQPPKIDDPGTTDEMLRKHFNIKRAPSDREVFSSYVQQGYGRSMVDTFFDNLSSNLYSLNNTSDENHSPQSTTTAHESSIETEDGEILTEELNNKKFEEEEEDVDWKSATKDDNNGQLSRQQLADQLLEKVDINNTAGAEEEDIAALDELIKNSNNNKTED